jgi:hypothetical protein
MKLFHFAMPLLLGAAACADNTPTLQVLEAVAPNEDCVVSDSGEDLYAGSLNLALANSYLMGFVFTSNLRAEAVNVGDSPVADENTNTIYLDEMNLSYAARDAAGNRVALTDASVTVPIYGVVAPGARGVVAIPLLTSEVVTDITGAIGGADDVVSVSTTLTFSGKTLSGATVESNEITFPLSVVARPFSCPAGQQVVPSSLVCPVGLNGAVPECEDTP